MAGEKVKPLEDKIRDLLLRISTAKAEITELERQKQMLSGLHEIKKENSECVVAVMRNY